MLANLGNDLKQSQADVTVYPIHGLLVASDEVDTPYAIDPGDLSTIGRHLPTGAEGDYKAHVRHNPVMGDWIMLANSYGSTMKIWAGVRSKDGHIRHTQKIDLPRRSYIHDFLVTERYAVVNIQAFEFSPWGYLFGRKSFIDGFVWKPELSNTAVIIDLSGMDEPVMIDAPLSWMWHALNAYEMGGEIIADFVG